jgi:hypothetical protein
MFVREEGLFQTVDKESCIMALFCSETKKLPWSWLLFHSFFLLSFNKWLSQERGWGCSEIKQGT